MCKRSSTEEVKDAAEALWDTALKNGRTDNPYVDMSFVQYWNEEGIVEGIVFTHPEPEDIETIPYAKLRYDMFDVEQ